LKAAAVPAPLAKPEAMRKAITQAVRRKRIAKESIEIRRGLLAEQLVAAQAALQLTAAHAQSPFLPPGELGHLRLQIVERKALKKLAALQMQDLKLALRLAGLESELALANNWMATHGAEV
jgi:hypothetical protein